MAFTKSIIVFTIIVGISMVYCGNDNISLKPKSVLTYSLEELLDFTCTAVWDKNRLTSNNTNELKFYIGYKLHNIEQFSFYLKPANCYDSYCDTHFNVTFAELRSLLNSSYSEFDVDCIAFIGNDTYGSISSSPVLYSEGKALGEECSPEVRCNENANLSCVHNICGCKPTYILINSTDNKQLCYSKAYHGDSCSYDEQCVDKHAICIGNATENKTCECNEYYVYNGYFCCSNSSYWCDILWFDYDWFSSYWTDIFFIMIVLALGICVMSIVIAISINLRMRVRKAGQQSQQPLDNNLKNPQNYSQKQVFGDYFGKKGDDKQNLTEHDYNAN